MGKIKMTRDEKSVINKMKYYIISCLIGVACIALETTGCVDEEQPFDDVLADDPSSGEASGEDAEMDIVEAADPLTVCTTSHSHGGDLFSGQYDIIMGCACGSGMVRSYYNVWNTGHGNCSALGWASKDVHDCRIRVRIYRSGGYANGTCYARADAVPEPNRRSCEGRCGHQAPSGCWCDNACSDYGDCCPDYRDFCR